MLITCITHADARDKKTYPFRGLTEQGWQEVQQAAARFKELLDDQTAQIAAVVSSPKARCVETALLFAKAVSDHMATSELQLDASLKAGSIEGQELYDLANNVRVDHVLVAAHADLVTALPQHAQLKSEAAQDGWFTTRPVLIIVKYKPGDSWTSAEVVTCESLLDGRWQSLLA